MFCYTTDVLSPSPLSSIRREKGTSTFLLFGLLATLSLIFAAGIYYFGALRQRAFDIRAMQTLREGLISQEAYYISAQEYVPCVGDECASTLPNFRIAETVHIGFRIENDPEGESLYGVSCSSRGSRSGRYFFRAARISDSDQFRTIESRERCSDDAVSEILSAEWPESSQQESGR